MANTIERNLNGGNPVELLWAARNYCENPSYWEENWLVTQKAIDQAIVRITAAASDPSHLLLIAESSTLGIIGFHWIRLESVQPGAQRYVGFELDETESAFAQVVHLWIHPDYSNQGIAKSMKRGGEKWAAAKEVRRIQTSVNYRNKKMFDLNVRLGFEPGQVVMSKKLVL